jgi:multidrug efflux system membrane fusion protein
LTKSLSFVLGGFLILTVCSAIGWNSHQAAKAGQARPTALPVPVGVARVALKDVPVYLTGLGTVQAYQTVAIHPQVEGVLEDVLFIEGQHVKKGDVLARIEPRLFVAALDQAKAKKAQDSALLVAAEKDLNRFTALGSRNIVSRQDIEQQQAKFDQLSASIAADDAAIETAQTQLSYTSIRAPNDGRVGIRLIDSGNLVRASDPGSLTTLVVTRPSAVLFTLPSNDLDDVRAAMSRGLVEVIAWDQDNKHILSRGRLLLIDNSIDAATATIRLKAMFANSDDRLWPGEFVNARVLIETRRSVVTIPTSAVQRGPQGLFAWVVSANQTVQSKPIQLGPTTDDLTIVTDGLTEGETVVTEGQYKLQPGARVTTSLSAQPSANGTK